MAEKGKEEDLTKKPGSDKGKDFKDSNLPEEGTKGAGAASPESSEEQKRSKNKKKDEEKEKPEEIIADPPPARESVRGEDVIKMLREKGHKI